MANNLFEDDIPGQPGFELGRVERDALAILVEVTKREKRDLIFDSHLTKFDIGDMSPAVLRGAIKGLEKKGVLTSHSELNGSDWWEFTAEGAEYAYTIRPLNVPASDRFVTVGDNSKFLVEAQEAIEKLSTSVAGANNLYADAEERLQISKELNFLGEVLSKPKIHVLTVWDNAKNNSTLKFLANQTISFVVREDAGKVLEALHQVYAFLASLL